MVKSPKIRHSKQRSEPVTIDLSADDVKRDKPKTSSSAKDSAEPKTGSAETTVQAGQTDKPAGQSTATGNDKPGSGGSSKTSGTASASSSAFGRAYDASAKVSNATEAPRTPPHDPVQEQPRRVGALVAGIAGGVVVLLAGGAALYFAGIIPPAAPMGPAPDNTAVERLETELAAMREEIAALRDAPPAVSDNGELDATLAETNGRIENMAVMVEELRAELGRLSDAVAAGDAGDGAALAPLQERLAALEQRVAALPESGADTQALSEEINGVADSVAALRSDMETAVAGTASRMSAIEDAVASLGARLDEQANDPGVALAIAASALKAAIDRGQPFAAELETFASIAPGAPEIAALREYASTGVPTAAAIAAEAGPAAVRIIDAARPDNAEAGLLDRLWASAESLITVRPIGAVEGDDVPAIAARMEAAVKSGDYVTAIAEYETLPDGAKAAAGDFIAKVRARQTADELIGRVLAAALKA